VSDEHRIYRGEYRRRARPVLRVAVSVMLLLAIAGTPATAQETREQAIADQQATKAQALTPPQDSKAEKVLNYINDSFLVPKPRGFYPFFGSVYSGGGFTMGVGYRQAFADHSLWTINGLYSIKNYKQAEFEIGSHDPESVITYGLRGGWRDATQVGYYGVGQDRAQEARANFGFEQGYGGGWAKARPGILSLEAEATFEDYNTKEGAGGFPSIEERYTPSDTPGLFADPRFVHVDAAAGIDWRPAAEYARTGGYYGMRLNAYHDVDDVHTFNRLDGDIVQHIPILRETFVLSLRGRVQTILDDDDVVPYFLLPYLGGGRTLRAYRSFRFRDRHSILTSAEWRWIPSALALDMAIFYDAGKVTSRREDLDLQGLAHDVGVGIRFHGPATTALRVELARGSDGWHVVFATSAPF
jgi:hypothetical protein